MVDCLLFKGFPLDFHVFRVYVVAETSMQGR